MDSKSLEKLSAASNILFATLLLLWGYLWYVLLPFQQRLTNFALLINDEQWIILNVLGLIGVAFGIFGLFGIYLKQLSKTGVFGLISFLLVFLSLLMWECAISWEVVIWPVIVSHSPSLPLLSKEMLLYKSPLVLTFYYVYTLLFAIGYILFGIVSIRSKVFPKWPSIIVMIGAPVNVIGVMLPDPWGVVGLTIYATGIFGYGIYMLRPQ